MCRYWANKDRDVAREQERLEKERMRALRNDDEEAYLRLLEQSKNERLIRMNMFAFADHSDILKGSFSKRIRSYKHLEHVFVKQRWNMQKKMTISM